MRKLIVAMPTFNRYQLARYRAVRALYRGTVGIEISGVGTYDIPGWRAPDSRPELGIEVWFDKHYSRVSRWEIIRKAWQRKELFHDAALAFLGYRSKESLPLLTMATTMRCPVIMLSDTWRSDGRKRPRLAWLKRLIVSRFDAAVVAGELHRSYAIEVGIPRDRCFLGYDVVDGQFFHRGSENARSQAAELRAKYALPERYFIFVGRFDPVKNIPYLLHAYARYRMSARTPWSLVLCGSGNGEVQLRNTANMLCGDGVHFMGFRRYEELPIFYGLAKALVAPSKNDTWNLTVNEAMACGLPVLVSLACGCAVDLVKEGVNGFTFDPRDVEGLSRLMAKVSSGEVNLETMGRQSRQIISYWSPEFFAENLLKAVEIAAGNDRRRDAVWFRRRARDGSGIDPEGCRIVPVPMRADVSCYKKESAE